MNIDLELVADVNVDLAFRALASALTAGGRTHRSGTWRTKPITFHIGRARRHLELLHIGEASKDHLGHALARLAMAVELRERAGRTAAAVPRDLGQEPARMGQEPARMGQEPAQMGLFSSSQSGEQEQVRDRV
jgi:hypothetical protein